MFASVDFGVDLDDPAAAIAACRALMSKKFDILEWTIFGREIAKKDAKVLIDSRRRFIGRTARRGEAGLSLI